MEFLMANWFLIVVGIAILACVGYAVYRYMQEPTEEKLAKVKEWLLFAVTAAEKELGSGTGQIKLRYVYDMFLTKFSYLAKSVSFETFSDLVDQALDKFRGLLDSNVNLKDYVGN